MPQISVIVPVFKVEKYLERCVNSIQAQTFSDLELILVDDGTPDLCGAYCDTDALADERIIVIHHRNQGQGAARNRGVAVAAGVWVHFVDSDDLIHPQMLEILHDSVLDTDVGISMCVYHEANKISEEFYRIIPYPVQKHIISIDEEKLIEFMNDGGTGFYWVVWGKLLDKRLVVGQEIPEGHFYEDNAVANRWLHMAGQVVAIDEPLYFYQVNDSGTTKGMNPNKFVDILWSLSEQINYLSNIGFKTLTQTLLQIYFEKAIGYYWVTIREHKDKMCANCIRKNAITMFLKNYMLIPLHKSYGLKILRMFFP